MAQRLAAYICTRPWRVIGAWAILAVAAFALAMTGIGGKNVFDRVDTMNGVLAPNSESAQADTAIAASQPYSTQVLLTVSGVDMTNVSTATEAAQAIKPIDEAVTKIPHVLDVLNPFSIAAALAPLPLQTALKQPQVADFIAADKHGFLVTVDIAPGVTNAVQTTTATSVQAELGKIAPALHKISPSATGLIGGKPSVVSNVNAQMKKDLALGEAISFPIALIVMILVFAGFLAAAMPLVGALASISVGLGVIWLFTFGMSVDNSTIDVLTVLALGLSIDYGLFIVSRFREELQKPYVDADTEAAITTGELVLSRKAIRHELTRERPVDQALADTLRHAGRTVFFSGLTVALCMGSLMVFRVEFLRVYGLVILVTVLFCVASAITLVPAVLVLLGRRVIAQSPISRIPHFARFYRHLSDVTPEKGIFSRLAGWVQRWPVLVMLGVLVILGVLAVPAASLQIRSTTVNSLPLGSESRVFTDYFASQYPQMGQPAITIVSHGGVGATKQWANQTVATITGVHGAPTISQQNGLTTVNVAINTTDTAGSDARNVVTQIRDHRPADFSVQVTGDAARIMDFSHLMWLGAPWAAGIIAIVTLILLFFMTGSLFIPIKALIVNTLSLCASLGVTTWIFQDGHGSSLLDFTTPHGIESYIVVLMLVFGFGLAMDYEVFLISRMKEVYEATGDNAKAISVGLQRSGRIVTSAALIIIAVFLGFATGRLLFIKEIGIGLAVMVAIDATLVRMLLVPAVMALMGRWNWWAPAGLKRVYERWSIKE